LKLSDLFPDFEHRPEQEAMQQAIASGYENPGTLLIEAGTGTGKTLAYLLPATLWAIRRQERTVISTHTIALQQQLVEKDIPLLIKALGVDIKVSLVKGMRHFSCLKKEQELLEDVTADRESCTHIYCPFYQKCNYFKQHKEAEKAEIIVVNHHLLLADLALRKKSDQQYALLPDYQRVIIDEAHHLEEIATEHFAQKINKVSLYKLLQRMSSEQMLSSQRAELALSLPLNRKILMDAFENSFRRFPFEKMRITEDNQDRLQKGLQIDQIFEPAYFFLSQVAKLDLPEAEARLIGNLYRQLSSQVETLKSIFFDPVLPDEARWLEDETAVLAKLDVAPFLKESLFEAKKTVVLCSATLTAGKKFDYLKQRLGIEQAQEKILDSPFEYEKQALLAISDDLPDPADDKFANLAYERILQAIEISQGSAFVLFTSHHMMMDCQSYLGQALEQKGFSLHLQGQTDRHALLQSFKTTKGAVLFGTDSFWEGVDVVGEDLRLVIITKLPFRMPKDPLFEARCQWMEQENKTPFIHYALPQAIVKFRQGFGRLIRHKEDKGVVLCLDKRMIQKGYGKKFLKSLPPCPVVVGGKQLLSEALSGFYRQSFPHLFINDQSDTRVRPDIQGRLDHVDYSVKGENKPHEIEGHIKPN
jgi:ATP-dependent DNA helicase DinG